MSLELNSILKKAGVGTLAIAMSVVLLTGSAFCDKKKKKEADKPKPNLMDILDLSKIVIRCSASSFFGLRSGP